MKDVEYDYFLEMKVKYSRLFGPNIHQVEAGVTDLAMTPNKSLLAASLSNGAILIFDSLSLEM